MTIETQSGKSLIYSVFRHQETSRVPWVPFAGIHAGKLAGYNARELLTDADKLYESLMAVQQQYVPDGMPVVFDLQLEAEILGCKLMWADYNPPSVSTHPLAEIYDIPDYLPAPTDGRLPIVLDVMRRVKKSFGNDVALYGLITGPFTLASHLRGTNIFLDSYDNADYLCKLMDYVTKVCLRITDYYLDTGMDVIALVDPLVSQVSPEMFEQFLAKSFKTSFDYIREKGALSSFFVCGDATRNIEAMCKTQPDCIAVDENVNMVDAKEVTDRYNIALSGNVPLTTRMLFGTQEDNMMYVLELMDTLTHKNLIISPGCDMPYDTPVENTISVMQTIREPEIARKVLENYKFVEEDIEVILPDYANLSKPLIEVFTLDSESCAACTYMFGAAKRVAEEFKGKVDLVEYKFTVRENIARVKKMGVKNLPSIYVNGELKFSSIIPDNRELTEIIKQYLK